MKIKLKIFLLSILLSFLVTGVSFASTFYTFQDSYTNWPGYDLTTLPDEYGTPEVGDMVVEVSDAGMLVSVAIDVKGRRYGDSLFINSNYLGNNIDDTLSIDWQSWDYYVKDYGSVDDRDPRDNNFTASGLYTVEVGYSYTLAPVSGREGHPNGILDDDFLDELNAAFLPAYNNDILFYDFSGLGIEVGEKFVIGYTPWCANDVLVASPVPEPGTMLLLGMGLLGIAGVSRKKIKA